MYLNDINILTTSKLENRQRSYNTCNLSYSINFISTYFIGSCLLHLVDNNIKF